MKFEFDLSEGDMLKMNDRQWFVKRIKNCEEASNITMISHAGDIVNFSKSDLQESIDFSGEIMRLRQEYHDKSFISD